MPYQESIDGRDLETYIPQTIGPDTHRKLSEQDGLPIDFVNARAATQEMKRRIEEVFHGFSDSSFEAINWESSTAMRAAYALAVDRAQDSPVIDASRPFESYLQVNVDNHSDAIKRKIREDHEAGSIPATVVNMMDIYESSLSVTGQDAAGMVMRLVTASLPAMSLKVREESPNLPPTEVTTHAFEEIEISMPDHVQEIQRLQRSMKINAKKAQAQVVGRMGNESLQPGEVIISKEDQKGLLEAFHIQDRPYKSDELLLASRILNDNKYMANTFIAFQLLLMSHAWDYFSQHPERSHQTLEPYNTIFVPIIDKKGDVDAFAPNPRLLRTMSNN